MSLVQVVRGARDQDRARPPFELGVVVADPVSVVLALADVGERLTLVVLAEEDLDARVTRLAPLQRLRELGARRHEYMARPVEKLRRQHAVRPAVDEEQFERLTLAHSHAAVPHLPGQR